MWFLPINKHKQLFIIILLILCSLPAVLPLFHPGFFVTDDGDWMIIRFSAFHTALTSGQLPVRFLPRLNHEYGYPVANFLYPGFMYLAEIPRLLRFGFVDSVKIIAGISLVASSLFVYFWLKKYINEFAAFVGGLLYLYAPYHLYDLYQRGSIGEILALSVVPFVLWQLERWSVVAASCGIGLLLLSHNTLAMLFIPVLIAYRGIQIIVTSPTERIEKVSNSIITFCLGFGLAAFFWLPALADLSLTIFHTQQISNISSYFSLPTSQSLEIMIFGFLLVIGILCLVFSRFLKKAVKTSSKQQRYFLLLFCLIGFISLVMNVPQSEFVWKLLPLSFIQFPFRLLSLEILAVTFLVSFLISRLKGLQAYIFSFFCLGLLLLAAFLRISSIHYTQKGEGFYTTNEDTTTVKNEYMPAWVRTISTTRPETIVESKQAIIDNLTVKGTTISFSALVQEPEVIRINQLYFPGWKIAVNNQNIPVRYDTQTGSMLLPLSPGENTVVASFGETPLRFFADGITGISGMILVVYLFMERRRKKSL